MKTSKKLVIGLSLVLIFIVPTLTNFTEAKSDKINVIEDQTGITLQTNYMTLKIVENNPHFIWWYGNQSTSDEMYNVQITKVQEYFGDDDILDNHTELKGISYNLLNNEWEQEIIEGDHFVTVTLTLSGLANGVEIQFIMHIYSEDIVIAGTDQIVEALSEVKFDIVVNNWLFSNDAAGLAFHTQTLESQEMHQVKIRNGTSTENGNASRLLQFESDDNKNKKVAYFGWTTFADIYNEFDIKIDTIDVGNAFLIEGSLGQGSGDPGIIQMYLTYPNYGDSLKLVHDPFVGVYPESFSMPLNFWSIIGGIIASVAIAVIINKRRK